MKPQDARLLAVLLLADGRAVPYTALPHRHGLRGEPGGPQRTHAASLRLRSRGLDCVEWGRFACRLTRLPPDWALDDVLLAASMLRAEHAS